VDDKTEGLIEQIIEEIPPDVAMYLLNTIYFRADWELVFPTHDTREVPFNLTDGSQIQCQMMLQRQEDYYYYEDDSAQVIRLNFDGSEYGMVIILPAEGKNIDDFVSEFTQSKWETWVSGMEMKRVIFRMPRFKFEYGKELNDVLEALGIREAFNAADADFSDMTEDVALFISQVMHKTTIEVNEKGTVAAAATSVTMAMGMSDHVEMHVTRPFLFTIYERTTDTVLFMGKVAEPKYE
jgi:serpin B